MSKVLTESVRRILNTTNVNEKHNIRSNGLTDSVVGKCIVPLGKCRMRQLVITLLLSPNNHAGPSKGMPSILREYLKSKSCSIAIIVAVNSDP